jgi:two-component system, cell cycle response regulator
MKKKKILLVEDSSTQAIVVSETLQSQGFEVVSKLNGIDALKYMKENIENLPDLIITDIVMPEMDGYEFCRIAQQTYPNTFVIVLTIKKTNSEIQKAFEVGATEFIAKPMHKSELIMRIRNVLKIKEANAAIKKTNADLAKTKDMLQKLTVVDETTKLFSRKYLLKNMQHKIYDSKRYGFPFSAIMLNIDDFKAINNNFGHKYGDEVLRKISARLLSGTRETDILGRFGDDTFLLLLPNTKLKESIIVAEKVRKTVSNIKFLQNPEFNMTVSCGVVEHNKEVDIKEFTSKLEFMLQKAKKNGKDRIES